MSIKIVVVRICGFRGIYNIELPYRGGLIRPYDSNAGTKAMRYVPCRA